MATKTSTRTPRTRKGATIATTDGVVIAEQQHVELPAVEEAPQTVLIGGAEVLAGTDPNEVAEAVAEIKAEAKPAKKLTNRELAVKAIEAWNEANGTQLVFKNHVSGNLLEAGTAFFAVMDGDTKMRARIITVAGGGAEVAEVFSPTPAKETKADEDTK